MVELFQLLCQDEMVLFSEAGIGFNNFLGHIPRVLEDLAVSSQVGDLQVEGYPALLGSFDIARTTEFKVDLGDLEAVVGPDHGFDLSGRRQKVYSLT